MPGQERNNPKAFLSGLREILGDDGLLTDDAARFVYSRDASHLTLGRPLAVALPRDESQLRRVVGLCRTVGVPVVCRGTGTGLSGGAVPGHGALVVGTSRLRDLGPVDSIQRRVRVQPGVLNDGVSRHASPSGLHFAPDPSSQSAASIGGNIAENAGGPHCLRHGVTLQHLVSLDWSDSAGRAFNTGRAVPAERGLDLVSLLCGSEGTLGLVTSADLKLVVDPAEVATLLAFFPDLEDAAGAVVGLLGEGLAPVAVEMVDQAMLLAVEEAFGFGFPTDVAVAMIIEFAGQPEAVAEDSGRAGGFMERHGASEVRRAADDSERDELWKCRKKAFGAVGRLAPNYVTMDVVVPLGELPGLVREIQVIKVQHGVEIATTFHAGDGNLHPGVHYDERDPDQTRRAHAAADAIIRAALDRDGSVTGEHGVGIEKLHVLPWQLDRETARLQRGIKDIFDPDKILNPGKLHPPADADFAALKPVPAEIDFHWANLTVSAPADASLAQLQQTALERGFWIPVGALAGDEGMGLGRGTTVGNLVAELLTGPALCPAGTARDFLLELWAETGDGRLFHAGAPVFKNVAGYDLVHMLCGSGRVWAQPRAVTFQLRPVPESLGYWRFQLPSDEQQEVTLLERLVEYLTGRHGSLGGPMMIVDAGTGSVVVLIPGRSRPWDLGQIGEDLANLLGTPAEHIELPFNRATEILKAELIPGWALNSSDWTFLCRLPDQEPGAGFRPAGMGRLIWQSTPRLIWSPDPETSHPGWHADRFYSGGRVQPPVAPAEGVPFDFLIRMKTLFDPSAALETPEWMEGRDG
ncbi:MAG: FAD-binding protein [Candidatus Krumholzibacteria bacterium]|nr:FAD-binding protein [Candidatus Krumholzibacteria bacterium]